MGLDPRWKVRFKNMKMIDMRIDMQGRIVDEEVKDFMIDKKRTTLLGLRKKKGNIFS